MGSLRCGAGALLSAFLVLSLGCAPLTPTVPFHLLETTEVLPARKVAIGFNAGGGALVQEGAGAGGGLRVRVGVGARQEVGLEGTVLYVDTGTRRGSGPRWLGESTAFGARLSWKYAPLPFLGVLAGAGAASAATGSSLSGDAGLLVSPGRPLRGVVRPYAAARFLCAGPVGRERDQRGGVTLGLAVPVGLGLQIARSVRLFLEGGGLLFGSSVGATADPAPTQDPPPAYTHDRIYPPALHGGFYGAAGVIFIIERNQDSASFLQGLQFWR